MRVAYRSISALVAWNDGNGMESICGSISYSALFPQ
jgi:hypothetical protein